MMRHVICVCVLAACGAFFCVGAASAETATIAEARRVAENWLVSSVQIDGTWGGSEQAAIVEAREITSADTLLGWCFSVRPRGYIVVPALKELPPVKVYSEHSRLNVDERDGFARLLRETLLLRARLFAQEYGDLAAPQPDAGPVLFDRAHRELWERYTLQPEAFAATLVSRGARADWQDGPLLETAWHQHGPYFDQCPPGDLDCEECDNGNEPDSTSTCCLTGCVATALSQIVNYHEWPPEGGSHSYYWGGDSTCVGDPSAGMVLSADYSDGYDWTVMPNGRGTRWSRDGAAEVAELCYEIGVAAETRYGRCASAARPSTAVYNLAQCLGYDPSWIERPRFDPCYCSAAQCWWDFLEENIERGWPVLYIIPATTAYDPGHAIVCDGVGVSDELGNIYHMNYGWADSCTAWYVVDNMPLSGGPNGEIAYAEIHPRPLGWNDCFSPQLAAAATLSVNIPRPEDVVSVYVMVSNDGGATHSVYAMTKVDSSSTTGTWALSGGASEFVAAAEIWYRVCVTRWDQGQSYDIPSSGSWYEFSILPLHGPPRNIIVDKEELGEPQWDGENFPGPTERYVLSEGLDILGYDFDTFELPHIGSLSNGPDSSGMKFYDTQIWLTGDIDDRPLTTSDQYNLVDWLNRSAEGKERNLFIVGKHIGYDMVAANHETCFFYEYWLAADYEGAVSDTVFALRDHAGGAVFMDYADGECVLASGPEGGLDSGSFDLVRPMPGTAGAEAALEVDVPGVGTEPVGVAYTNPVLGYQSVYMSIGLGDMHEYWSSTDPPSGIDDRTNLLENIMDYLGVAPTGEGTGVASSGLSNRLSTAYPNPFNPVTSIDYTVVSSGDVSIRIYNVAGRLVRTLLDEKLAAGSTGRVVWNGRDESEHSCPSGVYFYRIEAPGWSSERKLVLLK